MICFIGMKSRTFLAVFLLMLALAIVGGGRRFRERGLPSEVLLVGAGFAIRAEVADSALERIRGLSGRETLQPDRGLLFVFPFADYHGIWMKQMRFPIDIVWLQEARAPAEKERADSDADAGTALRVIDFFENAAPETFPEVFYPKEKATHVLEVNAGFVKDKGVARGDIFVVK